MFRDAKGDAIDVSGSEIRLFDIVLQDIADKGLSAGENSHVSAEGLSVRRVGIAVASKDLSHVKLEGAAIQAVRIGLAAFIKKPEYGGSRITASNVRFSETEREVLVDSTCVVQLDARRLKGSVPLDVKSLYELGVLGN